MRIGFIGAGKAGFTLGKYMSARGKEISGYFSLREASAKEAAIFTHAKYYTKLEDIVDDSDALFLTCPDGAIGSVWNQVKLCSIAGKCICHCSGSLSSAVFSEISRYRAYGYSIHPLFAISSKYESYREISKAYFTIEGNGKHLKYWVSFFEEMGNPVKIISDSNKTLYHAAAVFASNLVCALFFEGIGLLKQCGFDDEEARKALSPLFQNNAVSLARYGVKESLTGPLERSDILTIREHLSVLPKQDKRVYMELSKILIDIVREKNPENDYSEIKKLLSEDGV